MIKQIYQTLCKILIKSVLFGFLFLVALDGKSQCSGGGNGGALAPAPSSSYQTMNVTTPNYYTFTVPAGCIPTYDFSFCAADGSNASFDSQITILDNTGTYVGGSGYNDDVCGLQSHVTWTPSAAGTYRVLVSTYNCSGTTNTATLAYKYTSPASPCTTPSPGNTISSSNPVCSGASFTLSLQNATAGSCVSYQWESSTNNSTWATISGATSSTCSISQTSATYYRCNVICAANSTTTASSSLQVTLAGGVPGVATSPTPANSATNISKCAPALSWTAPVSTGCDAATSYDIYFGTSATPPFFANTTSTTYALGILNSTTVYYWKIIPKNATGDATGCSTQSFTTNSTACTVSPGGISTDLTLWLKPDAGVTITSGKVSQWNNQITNASLASAAQGTAGSRPTVTSNAVNFSNTVMNFDGSTTFLERLNYATFSDVLNTTNNSLFLAQKINSGSVSFQIEQAQWNRIGFENSGTSPRFDFPNDGLGQNVGSSSYNSNYHLNTMIGTNVTNTQYLDGKYESQVTHNQSLSVINNDYSCVIGKQVNGSASANCQIAEIVLYKNTLSAVQQRRVETYMAIKYGVTLGGNGAASASYESPSGTTVWAANTGFHYDITGIGAESAEGLQQNKSRSLNYPAVLGATNLPITIAYNSIAAPSNIADGTNIITGHNNGSISSNLIVNYTHGTTAIQVRLTRIWRLQTTNLPGGKAVNEIEIEFDMSKVPGNNGFGLGAPNATANLRLLLDDNTTFGQGGGNERAYTNSGVSGNLIKFSIPFGDLPANGVYYFTIGSVDKKTAPLPIELSSFEANCLNEKVNVSWMTSSEINNDYYTIHKSMDGINFESAANITGAGTSSQINNYSWVDEMPFSGNTYYQLSQTDFDGNSKTFNVVSVKCNDQFIDELSIMDAALNSSQLSFHFSTSFRGSHVIKLLDAMGNTLVSDEKYCLGGDNAYRFDVSKYTAGIYLIIIENNNKTAVKKVMVIK